MKTVDMFIFVESNSGVNVPSEQKKPTKIKPVVKFS